MQGVPVVMGPTCHLLGTRREEGGNCLDNCWVMSIKVKDGSGGNHMDTHREDYRFSFIHLTGTVFEMSVLSIMAPLFDSKTKVRFSVV